MVKEILRNYLIKNGQWDVEFNIDSLLDEGGYIDRFNFISTHLNLNKINHILISGCSLGVECNVASSFHVGKVTGYEIDPELVKMAQLIVKDNVVVKLYDGRTYPELDNCYDMVYSGHVIEHTKSPKKYIGEMLRVLNDKGIFFIEFPCRYHHTELHTGLPSYEMYGPLKRPFALFFNAINIFKNDRETRKKYAAVYKTLKPISRRIIELHISNFAKSFDFIAMQIPADGYVRLLYRIHK